MNEAGIAPAETTPFAADPEWTKGLLTPIPDRRPGIQVFGIEAVDIPP